MCCRCHLQPGTGGRNNQSPWTSGAKGAVATGLHAREVRKGKKMDGGGRGETGRRRRDEERRWTANTETGEEPGRGGRREPDGKCIRSPGSGAGGAAQLPATLQEKRGSPRCFHRPA
ncbi:hypothetical protein NDU88_002501 [Pleurodeles waltl]|uniref:Uncharacterized protein n=1 Tax=Pleurodeles waltl TaxID=8319 RepID=A0AAV7UXT3_PLEWA|nr:hypothetical protein NDU88_002501 [Pleurodeles waltl]